MWIGYHQFGREAHGRRTPPDPTATLKYMESVNPRPAEWPKADFIVGNPPYIGSKRMRDLLGDGYVHALRATYPVLPESADFVMYWWYRASRCVGAESVHAAGLITTNSIAQVHARPIVRLVREAGSDIVWAAPDHPWNDEVDGAAVRVAMTVQAKRSGPVRLVEVDNSGLVVSFRTGQRFNDNLSITADVSGAAATVLSASAGIASMGFALHGAGFLVADEEAHTLFASNGVDATVLRPSIAGRDLTQRDRHRWAIDFAYMSENEARAHAVLFDLVRNRVKPERDANAREVLRRNWWQFGWPRRELRRALEGLSRSIVTTETSKYRSFQFIDAVVAPDHSVVVIALDDSFAFGVLGSTIHVAWAMAAGARLGVGNDPRYTKTLCFDPFPFPDPTPAIRTKIGALAERLDVHRKDAIARDERVTMTGMYNVVEKLRSGEVLTPKERTIHEIAACGVLRDLNDELDILVADAYGWPWPMEKEEILERLVKLHDERVEEEKRGRIRWLRPEYQIPRFAPAGTATTFDLRDAAAAAEPAALRPWPATAVEQLAAIGVLVGHDARTAEQIGAVFAGAKRELVARHLETLALMGEIAVDGEGYYSAVRKVG